MVVGIPGILLAILVRMTVAEPIRGLTDKLQSSNDNVSFSAVLKTLWSRKSFRHLAMGAGLNAFCGYSAANWTASFMIRSHDMSTGELGTWLSLIFGLGGAIGVFGGGVLADRLAPRDKRWYAWLPTVVGVLSVPFMIGVYIVPNGYLALTLAIIPGIVSNVYLGNTIATTHGLVQSNMRAMSSAILFLILNIIGLGMGPWTIGMVSDLLTPTLGDEALRTAMGYILPAVMLWSACHFLLAARTLREDLAAAQQ